MKINKLFIALLFALVSCNGESQSNNSNDAENSDVENLSNYIEFFSFMRPDSTIWPIGQPFTDTLTFIGTNDYADYWYSIFETKNNDTVNLIYGEEVDLTLITSGSIVEINWILDSCYEAGEGDELYFDERIFSFKVLDRADNFEAYLTEFLASYVLEDDNAMDIYQYESIGIFSTFNPGVYCMLVEKFPPNYMPYFKGDYIISNEFPKGFICDEFTGIEDGFYYKEVFYEDLPEYTDTNEEGDFISYQPEVPEEYNVESYRKVMLIYEEGNNGTLYFIQLDGEWYFWIEHLCDCSA